MTANIRCYDPTTGQVTFDISKNLGRILDKITLQAGQTGTYTHSGTGQLFGYFIETYTEKSPYMLGFIENNAIEIVGNKLNYHAGSVPCVLVVGVVGGN